MDPEIDKRFYALGTKVAAAQSIEVTVKKLATDLDDLKFALEEAKGKFGDFDKFLKSLERKIEGRLLDLDMKMGKHLDALSSLKDKHDEIYQNSKLEAIAHKSYADSMQKDSQSKIDELHDSHSVVNQNFTSLEQKVQFLDVRFLKHYTELQSKAKGIEQKLNTLQDQIDVHVVVLNDANKKMAKESEDNAAKFQAHKKDITLMVAQADTKNKAIIDGLKKSIPVIDEKPLEQKIADSLELVKLDAANAIVKSNNNETQIKFLEKKLENMTVLLKQNELKAK